MSTATGELAGELRERLGERGLRIGTRPTLLAKAQVRRVLEQVERVVPGLPVEVVEIQTSADVWTGDLAVLGGKDSFTTEIDRALVSGRIDVAVHSMKDVPADVPLPGGTEFGAYLERGAVHDVLISRDGRRLAELPAGATVGTASVRRGAQLTRYRPDLVITPLRGAVDSRIARLDAGECDALLLAAAGLERIGLDGRITEVLPTTWADGDSASMVPAVGAAVIGVQARSVDVPVMRLLHEIDHAPTARHVTAERAMLGVLRGHCNSPIAGHAHTTADGQLSLFGMVFNRDGSRWLHSHGHGPADAPASLGTWVAGVLLNHGAEALISATRH
jgi:hydroxymethylbilane synthase